MQKACYYTARQIIGRYSLALCVPFTLFKFYSLGGNAISLKHHFHPYKTSVDLMVRKIWNDKA